MNAASIGENGGQYTHGAVWAALEFVMQGDGDRAGELLSMLNPIRHADRPSTIHRYKVEPHVICADFYSEPPHVGRGGWTSLADDGATHRVLFILKSS